MDEGDHPAREEALRRLSEPAGDHELHSVLERMKEHHPHLWAVLHRVHFSDQANPAQLEDWRRAPKGSQEEVWAEHHDEPWPSSKWGYSRFRKSLRISSNA